MRRTTSVNRMTSTALALGVAVTAGWSGLAAAAPWRPLAPPSQVWNSTQPGVSRDAAGVLHVVWQRNSADLASDELVHTAIGADGTIGAPTPIVTRWSTVGTPDVVATPNGLLAVIAGFEVASQPNLATATSVDGGATWAVDTSKLVRGTQEQPSLTAGLDGTPFVAFGKVSVQRSFARPAPKAPDPSHDFQATLGPGAGCCGYNPDIERDGLSGAVWLSWYSSARGFLGNHVEQVDTATGAPIGPPILMPGSTTLFDGAQESIQPYGRAAIAAQAGTANMFTVAAGGYPSATKALVWRLGNPRALDLTRRFSRRDAIRPITVTGAPDGRMWVVWSTGITDTLRIRARRSNVAGTKWGAETVIRSPKAAVDGYSLDASVSPSGSLDVIGRFSFVNAAVRQDSAPYLTRMLPSLTLSATPAVVKARTSTTVRFRVTDAFVAVKGATVRVGSKTAVTDARGSASIRVEAGRRGRGLRASATASGYARGRTIIRVE